MSALTWREIKLRKGRASTDLLPCQGAGCSQKGKARHEPVLAGYVVESEISFHDRFLLCRSCRVKWEELWVEMGGSL